MTTRNETRTYNVFHSITGAPTGTITGLHGDWTGRTPGGRELRGPLFSPLADEVEAAAEEERDLLAHEAHIAARDYEEIAEQLGEIEAQHGSECAMFGDSWPGAQLQIARLREGLAAARREADAAWQRFAAAYPELPQASAGEPGDDDIPF